MGSVGTTSREHAPYQFIPGHVAGRCFSQDSQESEQDGALAEVDLLRSLAQRSPAGIDDQLLRSDEGFHFVEPKRLLSLRSDHACHRPLQRLTFMLDFVEERGNASALASRPGASQGLACCTRLPASQAKLVSHECRPCAEHGWSFAQIEGNKRLFGRVEAPQEHEAP